MKKKFVVSRQGNAQELTEQIKKQGWTEFGFPKKGKQKLTAKVYFPPKLLFYLQNGACIKVFQVKSGKAPNFKPRVDVVLEGLPSCFHSNTLLRNYLSNIPKKKEATIGIDINRLGLYMVSFNTPINLPFDLLQLIKRYNHLSKKVLPELNKGLLRKRKEYDSHGYCKLKGEISRVYNRRTKILREIVQRLPHFIAAVLVKKHCRALKIERLTINPTGARGALAKAIYNMPDNKLIYKKAVWLASLELNYDVLLEEVLPYHTSSHHFGCGGMLTRQLNQHDFVPCKKCGQQVNTHENAARNIASLPGKLLTLDPFPSSHVQGNHLNDG